MKIPLDRQSDQALYLQIRDRLKHLIQSGVLSSGQQLPSIRGLAESIQVNKLTVIEAYGMLEAEGLIFARQGAGYFVSTLETPAPNLASTFAPAQSVVIAEQSCCSFYRVYTTMLEARRAQDVIDFGLGFPHPPADLSRIARRAMTEVSETLFHYDHPQGQQPLRQQIAQMLIQLGLPVSAEDLIVTAGSQQGLFLALHHYVRPGDWVVVESPTYYGVLSILENLGARVIGIPMTAEGMNLDLLEQYLRSHRPKLIYTISTLHNPTGITTTQTHRQHLLTLAEQYECPILEDNAYEGLNFAAVPPPIKAIDQQGWVTYVGTFSKTIMPGLRVGFMVTNPHNHRALRNQKLLHDLSSSTVSQAIASEYLSSGHYRRHLHHLQTTYLQNRNAMLRAMEQSFPAEATWTIPEGGLFLWVQLPGQVAIPEVCQTAIAQGIAISDSSIFFPGKEGYPALRLSFLHSIEDIERGIFILGNLLKQSLCSPTRSPRPQAVA
ncbi:MAG: PLP-dependent aminotransferase family protein [Leptolyngbyaceae cyanobacterium bins.349]|nr:PLP-dependent aminotransferase family protein [Leptolyngbyaceae cyanobacterium bins.349]